MPEKSFWYGADFEWNGTEWKYRTGNEETDREQISVQDCTDTRARLRRLPPDKAKRTLGVYLALDGNNKKAMRKLRKKSEA